ncbi:hypothetical protein BAE44_0018184 [Dichanthelium oligosanthes]|uniref:Uncharacterized protein n=1 Tax=Dichanthelium oligosanthes TaxID=888268 RepID=A0A1E5V6M7_9POAL|nr:hypothetical protein BAE44_0018184 [Dichanthelium oligosanthes]
MTPPPRSPSSYLEEQTKVAGSRRHQGSGRGAWRWSSGSNSYLAVSSSSSSPLLSAAISAETELHGRRSRAVTPAGEFFLAPAFSSFLAGACCYFEPVGGCNKTCILAVF